MATSEGLGWKDIKKLKLHELQVNGWSQTMKVISSLEPEIEFWSLY